MSASSSDAQSAFAARFGGVPEVVAVAPGRVNLIGEHTDYNEGFVLPMAIERATAVAARRRDDRVLRAYAEQAGREVHIPLDAPFEPRPDDPWADYAAGVIAALRVLGHAPVGADALITGDVPIGCGLSSSASLTMALLTAFEALGGFALGGPEGALLGQRVENEFIGVQCGIMDPFVIRLAREGHALLLDCRSRAYEHIPASLPGAAFVIANTGVTRGLSGSKYNERVAECQAAVRQLQQTASSSGARLRDFTLTELDSANDAMGPVPYRRARHVISENARTLAAADALRAGDAVTLGRLMNASHDSLRDDYEVSCAELDAMVDAAREHPACLGARMTGAGFGGCTVLAVARNAVADFTAHLISTYRSQTGLEADIIVSTAAPGAHAKPRD